MTEIAGKKLTPRVERAMGEAAKVADEHGHDFVGTEHVLLGLLADERGVAVTVLQDLGVADQARERVRKIMTSAPYRQDAG